MKIISWFKKKFHIHIHSKIIASQYRSFNYRNVVVECKCGHRIIENRKHDCVFPFITNFISDKEMDLVLNHKLEVKREFSKE